MHLLIAGGGIGGLTTALCLARQGISSEVYEQGKEFEAIGAGIQLSPNCTRVLHYLGLEAALRKKTFLPTNAEIRDWKTGKLLTRTSLGNEPESGAEFPYYHIHRQDLIAVIVDAVRAEPLIGLRVGSGIESVHQTNQKACVIVAGKTSEGDGLIGADGIHSIVHTALFGKSVPEFTGNVAWRGLIPANTLTEKISPVAGLWWGPGKHFVHYFVRGGEMVNCVCVVEKKGWEIESWTQRGELEELVRDFAGWDPTITSLIRLMNPDGCYKWGLFDRPPLNRWSDRRITLLGDACHPTLPFVAQGAAMAIEDALVLSLCLSRNTSIQKAFVDYETLRKDRTAMIQKLSRRNAVVFHLKGISAWIRNRALRANPAERVLREIYEYDVFSIDS
ncbi:MAG: FAD-dependent monooxygenase [bacterium]|nr:hypothetical protein [Gammaproteobacteria bacterium]